MRVLTIANQKGGVGKTTTVYNVGAGLQRAGKKVLLIDLDTQADLTYTAGAGEQEKNIVDVIDNKASIHDVIQTTENGIHIIPSSLDLIKLESRKNLKFDFSMLKNEYDYILIDTPPTSFNIMYASTKASNGVIITTSADYYGYKAVSEIMQGLKTNNTIINGIVITRFNKQTRFANEVRETLEKLAKGYNTKIYKKAIRECNAIKESQVMQQDIYTFDKNCNASIDYSDLVKEILAEER